MPVRQSHDAKTQGLRSHLLLPLVLLAGATLLALR